MKFRRLVFGVLITAIIAAYFTKPTKEELAPYIQPTITKVGAPPIIEFEDKFLFVKVTATYVYPNNLTIKNGRTIAHAGKEAYIGIYGKYWKIN
ncbi:MAG: hypothetical protein ACK5NK_03270 [Niabella sp.]